MWTEAYGQGDPSPEKLNGHLHLDTGSLPPLENAGLTPGLGAGFAEALLGPHL